MRKVIRVAVVTMFMTFVAVPMFSVCGGPVVSTTTYYYQYHISCGEPDARGFRICIDYWSLDGECTLNCDGSNYCSGDTEMRSRTMTEVQQNESCDITCYPE